MATIIGVLPSEVVLRGGGLPEPVILSGLKVVQGSAYIPLRKEHNELHMYLTGQRQKMRLLQSSPIIGALVALRAAAREQAVASASGIGGPDEPDLVDDLGLDNGDAPKLPARRSRKQVLPETVLVTVERDGFPDWGPRILLDSNRAAVSMEASVDNFRILHQLVSDDLSAAGSPIPRKSGAVGGSKRPPRGPQGAREYWRQDTRRWVKKVLVKPTGGPGTSSPPKPSPDKRKFRTMIRRPSDEAAPKRRPRRLATTPSPGTGALGPSNDGDLLDLL